MLTTLNLILFSIVIIFFVLLLIPRTKQILTKNSALFAYTTAILTTFIAIILGMSFTNWNEKNIKSKEVVELINRSIVDLKLIHNEIHHLYKNAIDQTLIKEALSDPSTSVDSQQWIASIHPVSSPLLAIQLMESPEYILFLSNTGYMYLNSLFKTSNKLSNELLSTDRVSKYTIEQARNYLNTVSGIMQILRIESSLLNETQNEISARDKIIDIHEFVLKRIRNDDIRIYLKPDFSIDSTYKHLTISPNAL